MISPETKHLLYWWKEWAARLLRTTYHLFNRKAYRRWKTEFYKKRLKRKFDLYKSLSKEDYKLFFELDEKEF